MSSNIEFKDIPNSNYVEVFKDGVAVSQIEKGNQRMYDFVMKQVNCNHDKGLELSWLHLDGDQDITCELCNYRVYTLDRDLRTVWKGGYKVGQWVTVTEKDDPRIEEFIILK